MTAAAGVAGAQRGAEQPSGPVPEVIRNLKSMTEGIQPITAEERRGRIEKARRLMRENKLTAIVAESGSTLFYYTGTRQIGGAWILPASGDPVWVVQEKQAAGLAGDVRPFAESEGPYKKMAQALLTTTNLTGNPQVVVKCGFTEATLQNGAKTPVPRTLGFLGKIYDEGAPLRVALAYEQATEWHRKNPTL